MRMNIELDVDPSEFELASELIKTIRSVKVEPLQARYSLALGEYRAFLI